MAEVTADEPSRDDVTGNDEMTSVGTNRFIFQMAKLDPLSCTGIMKSRPFAEPEVICKLIGSVRGLNGMDEKHHAPNYFYEF